MSLFVSLNDKIVAAAEIRIPRGGIWDADVTVPDSAAITGAVTLVLAGLTLKGTVQRGEPWHGVYRARIVGGVGGWQTTIGPKGYRSITSVKASQVLGDAAREVGETLQLDEDFKLGSFFARMSGPACRVLHLLDRTWYMRADGVTVVGDRSTTTIASHFDVIDGRPELGVFTVATENPEDFSPGRHFASPTIADRQIQSVVHSVQSGSMRTQVWA